MPVKLERIPGESIIHATVDEPFDPEHDIRNMYNDYISLRMPIPGQVALIIDVGKTVQGPDSFSNMVIALAEISKGIRTSKSAGFTSPPIVILVGSGMIADLVAKAPEQEQYGGVRGLLCSSYEEALALAREKLAVT